MNPAEDYILSQEEPFKGILLQLQVTIEGMFPDIELKFKYRVPFYYFGKTPFCYLNAPRGKGFVDVGFWASAHLTKHLDQMVTENRKVMRSLRYRTPQEINHQVLTEILMDAHSVYKKGFWPSK
ncbi:MAG: DUF1801 domain-containing protein [Flavobacteriaceae bacterium]